MYFSVDGRACIHALREVHQRARAKRSVCLLRGCPSRCDTAPCIAAKKGRDCGDAAEGRHEKFGVLFLLVIMIVSGASYCFSNNNNNTHTHTHTHTQNTSKTCSTTAIVRVFVKTSLKTIVIPFGDLLFQHTAVHSLAGKLLKCDAVLFYGRSGRNSIRGLKQ